jgi:hypothetical protein
MTTAVLIGDVLLVIGGYVAAIYTWPRVKVLVNGLENEARALRAKARPSILRPSCGGCSSSTALGWRHKNLL